MALNDFFRINFPYGITQYKENFWYAYNREYLPLGFSSFEINRSELNDEFFDNYPLLTRYKSLDEEFLLKVADSENYIERDESGIIKKVFLYNDATNPQSFPKYWDKYSKKIKLLSTLEVKR